MSGGGRARVVASLALGALLASASACKLFKSTCDEDDRDCLGGGLARSGESCIRTGDCATGMRCREGSCEYDGSTSRGGECVVTAECARGHYCSRELECTPIDRIPFAEGVACGDSSECAKGLVCDMDLRSAMNAGPFGALSEPCREGASLLASDVGCQLPKSCTVRGKKDFGDACSENDECLAGLYCVVSPLADDDQASCLGGVELPVEPLSVPTWAGVDCPMDSAIPTAYFEVPFGAGAEHDFYRLPYPNDIRRRSGSLGLDDHPRPPASVEPPVATRFIDDASAQEGFSTNAAVYFRFSTAFAGGNDLSLASVRIVDITPSSPDYNTGPSIAWGPSERESHYICSHWLAIHRPINSPLRPNTTYAAIVTREVRTRDDRAFERSPDFSAMLQATAPSDPVLRAAWDAYAPLRTWLADEDAELAAEDLLNAAVFTTGHPQDVVTKLKAAVAATGIAELKELTTCRAGVKSPCEAVDGRGACQPVSTDFTEIHGKLALPIFQRGTPPYALPVDGGDVDATPRLQWRQDVCFALALPNRSAGPAGHPLLVYAHPIGGVFNEALAPGGLLRELAAAGSHPALLSIDLPQHGARRGTSVRPPEDLVLNYSNPAAMRGSVLQGAADLLGVIARARAGIPADREPSGRAIAFDFDRLALFAHGQGATHATLALAVDDRVKAVVLAGLAGHFANTSAQRTKPASSAALLPLLLVDAESDGRLPGGTVHPMLALMQRSLDAADPINYADRLFRAHEDAEPRHVFLVYGREDHFAPESSQEAFAKAAGLLAAPPDLSSRFRTLAAPVQNNVRFGSEERTIALRTYDPEIEPVNPSAVADGHFVVRATVPARRDVVGFLSAALAGEAPTIGAAE